MTTTHAIRILRSTAPVHVQATQSSPGLLVYRLPDTVNIEDPYRWRIGHHTGLAIGIAMSKEDAIAGAAALADLADWTQNGVPAPSGRAVARRLRRHRCYRAGY
ncbi:hypothetical protein AB0D90_14630 [Streptomyces althioticus]|uniref:hypothetical protein n=1 Tax=Streptomyces althioticus TaxID=83380 RepID=UPI0033C9E872